MRQGKTVIVALVCGLICAACVVAYTQSVRGEVDEARAEALAQYGGEQVEVCVAKRDLAAGETLDASSVETRLWVADLLPAEAIRSLDDVAGQTVSSTIVEGEVLSARKLGEVGSDLDVPDGLTAVSVPAKSVQVVGGAVSAGSKVDMYATGGTSTDLLAQDVLVLATSAGTSSKEGDVTWITIAIDPESVQEVVAATQKTELYFTLPGNMPITTSSDDSSEDADADADSDVDSSHTASQKQGSDDLREGSDTDASNITSQAKEGESL